MRLIIHPMIHLMILWLLHQQSLLLLLQLARQRLPGFMLRELLLLLLLGVDEELVAL